FSLSLGEVAERVGRSKPSVSNRIRLLELPDDVLGMVERGQLTEGHARAVLAVPDHEGRRRLAREIVRRGLSVRAAEQRAKAAGVLETLWKSGGHPRARCGLPEAIALPTRPFNTAKASYAEEGARPRVPVPQ